MTGIVTSITMVRDAFYIKDQEYTKQVVMLQDGSTHNVGFADSIGEVPPEIAFRLLDNSDAAPHTVDGNLIDRKEAE